MGLFASLTPERFNHPTTSRSPPMTELKRKFSRSDCCQQTRPTPWPWWAPTQHPHNALAGARENVKKHGFKVVYDQTYPLKTNTPRSSELRPPIPISHCGALSAGFGWYDPGAHEAGLSPVLRVGWSVCSSRLFDRLARN
jgi:hypothetical protein